MIFLRFWLWFLLEETLQTTSDFLAGDRVGVLLALGLARAFDLLVVSDTAPLLGLFFCRFEIPKAARKTVSIAMIPEFPFMTKPQWCPLRCPEPLKPLT